MRGTDINLSQSDINLSQSEIILPWIEKKILLWNEIVGWSAQKVYQIVEGYEKRVFKLLFSRDFVEVVMDFCSVYDISPEEVYEFINQVLLATEKSGIIMPEEWSSDFIHYSSYKFPIFTQTDYWSIHIWSKWTLPLENTLRGSVYWNAKKISPVYEFYNSEKLWNIFLDWDSYLEHILSFAVWEKWQEPLPLGQVIEMISGWDDWSNF